MVDLFYGDCLNFHSASPDVCVGDLVVFRHVSIVLLYDILHLRVSALVILWVSELVGSYFALRIQRCETTALQSQSTDFC